MTYTRRDLERDLEEHLANVAKELAEVSNDGTEQDARRQADRRYELQTRQRELEAHLAESRAKRSDGGYQEALMRQVRRMHTPVDSRRVELDRKVREHAQRTGDTYIEAANKLLKRGEIDA